MSTLKLAYIRKKLVSRLSSIASGLSVQAEESACIFLKHYLSKDMIAFPETINLELKSRHFLDARYSANNNCAIANALKEHFSISKVNTATNYAIVLGVTYKFNEYSPVHFNEDRNVASESLRDEITIRTITLTKK